MFARHRMVSRKEMQPVFSLDNIYKIIHTLRHEMHQILITMHHYNGCTWMGSDEAYKRFIDWHDAEMLSRSVNCAPMIIVTGMAVLIAEVWSTEREDHRTRATVELAIGVITLVGTAVRLQLSGMLYAKAVVEGKKSTSAIILCAVMMAFVLATGEQSHEGIGSVVMLSLLTGSFRSSLLFWSLLAVWCGVTMLVTALLITQVTELGTLLGNSMYHLTQPGLQHLCHPLDLDKASG